MSLILSGTDGLSDVDGSAATPAIRGTDANTGIFFPAADTIGFSEGGAEVARFNSSGNFGIGTTSPAQRLHVVGGQIQFNNGSDLYINPGASDVGFYSTGNIPTIFYTNSTERLRLNTSGTVILQGGSTSATGVGITFPATQSASSNANTLDDYEEGTWTPAYSVASGSITANSNTSGKYTKIGNVVYIWGYISYQSNSSASGAVTITGLPFTSGGGFGQSTNRSGGVYTIGNVFFGSNSPNFGNIPNGGTSIEPFISTATGGTGLTFANFDTSSANFNQFAFAGQYTV